jgi:hypothetical protein
MLRRAAIALLTAALGSATLGAAPAIAQSTIGKVGDELVFTGAPWTGLPGFGHQLDVFPTPADPGNQLRFNLGSAADPEFVAGPGCVEPPSSNAIDCQRAGVALIVVRFSIGRDILDADVVNLPFEVDAFEGNDDIDVGSANDVVRTGPGDDNISGNGGRDRLDAGGGERNTVEGNAGDDELTAAGTVRDVFHGDADDDLIQGGNGGGILNGDGGDDILLGGPGDEILSGGDGDDAVNGGAGDDLLFEGGGGVGSNDLRGGTGLDELRIVPPLGLGVLISLDDVANDGFEGDPAPDNARPDIEVLTGSSQDDVLTGGPGDEELLGGDGSDQLDGGPGFDLFDAGAGNDQLRTRDGIGERIACGLGHDTAITDAIVDELAGCEAVDAGSELVSDFDRDGVAKPDDCNDSDPAFRPGAPDAPDNGRDEDCSGADATDLDRDRDGSPRPFDCDDGNAAIRPGAPEVFGDPVDQDCNGRADPLQTITAGVQSSFVSRGRATRIVKLRVVRAPRGSRVEVRCTGGGCPFNRRTLAVTAEGATLNVKRALKLTRLRAGGTLQIRIVRDDAIGKVVRFRFRRGKLPSTERLCLRPGTTQPRRC